MSALPACTDTEFKNFTTLRVVADTSPTAVATTARGAELLLLMLRRRRRRITPLYLSLQHTDVRIRRRLCAPSDITILIRRRPLNNRLVRLRLCRLAWGPVEKLNNKKKKPWSYLRRSLGVAAGETWPHVLKVGRRQQAVMIQGWRLLRFKIQRWEKPPPQEKWCQERKRT